MKLKTDFLFSVQNFIGCFIVLFLETVSLMCFSVSQLFVYRNSTDICVNFISHHLSESVDQLQGFSGEIFSVCICVYAKYTFIYHIFSKKCTWTPSLPICMPLISFSCVSALDKTSCTRFNSYGDSGLVFFLIQWKCFEFLSV